ncbi:hypothetical protein DVH05_015485 [Phytophthora capsici]|nr:hypothetical protein DVH05_015485 [Phytophthora capsici]
MVSVSSVYLFSAVLAFATLQGTTATSLSLDPYTTCTSYENFPGRDTDIKDGGSCTVIVPEDPSTSTSKRKLEWVDGNDIADLEAHFGVPMERKLRNLPTSTTHSSPPWSGGNWLVNVDSINYVWDQGQPSAAEKYATAFGLDVKTFMDDVSAQNGIDSVQNATECTEDKECYEDLICAKRAGKSSGRCLPTWWGMGNAWAAAATLEKEPKCPVTFNGVTFQPMDIKALVTDIYDSANVSYVFTGSRYNGYEDSIDDYGRHTDASYRDLNPGFLHIAATNMLGLLNTTFIVDKDPDYVVWNQPVVGFEVREQMNMTPAEAAKKLYGLDTYPWNVNASSIVYVNSYLSWVTESLNGPIVTLNTTETGNYTYLLELNDDEEIIGGEWLYDSNDYHPDFLWLLEAKPAPDTATSFGLSYTNVTMLLEKATEC